jgi:hypothetical protein
MATKNVYSKLIELGNSGYEIVSDEPDIRNWKVINGNGKLLGVVNELLVDRQLNKIRYIVLHLNGKPLNLVSRKLLIPIGIAELDENDDTVILPNISIEHLATLPDYRKGKLTLDAERKIRNIFSSANIPDDYTDNTEGDTFYEHEHFNDTNLSKRKKKSESRERERAITDESSNVEDRTSHNGLKPFHEGVIEITENAEVPVVTKETRVVEEVSLNKEVRERDEKVRDTVRNTELDIEDLNNDRHHK